MPLASAPGSRQSRLVSAPVEGARERRLKAAAQPGEEGGGGSPGRAGPLPPLEGDVEVGGGAAKKGACLLQVEKIKARREERRRRQEQHHEQRRADRLSYGNDLDHVEYFRMIEKEKEILMQIKPSPMNTPPNARVRVMVRKRPFNKKEHSGRVFDVVTMYAQDTGKLILHEPKTKVDLTKCVENHSFQFDTVFDEGASNQEVYDVAIKPLVHEVIGEHGCMATAFAHGQTGSGKTYTMSSVYSAAVRAILAGARRRGFAVSISFVEGNLQDPYIRSMDKCQRIQGDVSRNAYWNTIVNYKCPCNTNTQYLFHQPSMLIYGGRCFDLLAGRKQVNVMEDHKGEVKLVGIVEKVVANTQDVLSLIEAGTNARTTGSTSANETSSRSHSIFQISLSDQSPTSAGATPRKLSLIDLAGSERGADTCMSDRKTRQEGAEINKSLLALKECIRALGSTAPSAHVPFRGSKLTQVLRDAFIGDRSRTVLLAHVAPASDSAEHSVNTLRYADRLKELGRASPDNLFQGGGEHAVEAFCEGVPIYKSTELETHYMADMPVAGERDVDDEFVEVRRNLPDPPKLKPPAVGGSGAEAKHREASHQSPCHKPTNHLGRPPPPPNTANMVPNDDKPSTRKPSPSPGRTPKCIPKPNKLQESQVLLDKLDKSDHAVQAEEEDLRAVHSAMLSEQKKLIPEELQLNKHERNMEVYVEQLEQIMDLRAAFDAKLKESIAKYKRALLDEDTACRELKDMLMN